MKCPLPNAPVEGVARRVSPRVVIVSNMPVPYRMPVFDRIKSEALFELSVIYLAPVEPNRYWVLDAAREEVTTLKPRILSFSGRYIHFTSGLLPILRQVRPDVVMTTGYNPAHLAAYLYTRLHGIGHVVHTDGTFDSERGMSRLHKLVRRIVRRGTDSYVGASKGSQKLFESLGVPATDSFRSPLAVDNAAFAPASPSGDEKDVDLLFCGRLEAIKNPEFILDVADRLSHSLGRKISLAFVGTGSLESLLKTRAHAMSDSVNVSFAGFAQQDELPSWYRRSRLFLFPTTWDPWGLVANEAAAAGLPILVSREAGVANELVIDQVNGRVLALDPGEWAEAARELLKDPELYGSYSAASLEIVSRYTYASAALGLIDAINHSIVAAERRADQKLS